MHDAATAATAENASRVRIGLTYGHSRSSERTEECAGAGETGTADSGAGLVAVITYRP
jgi:hypothetical protein